MALLDVIDAPALAADYRVRVDQLQLFRHLCVIRCHEDPPRRAYIERTMRRLARDSGLEVSRVLVSARLMVFSAILWFIAPNLL